MWKLYHFYWYLKVTRSQRWKDALNVCRTAFDFIEFIKTHVPRSPPMSLALWSNIWGKDPLLWYCVQISPVHTIDIQIHSEIIIFTNHPKAPNIHNKSITFNHLADAIDLNPLKMSWFIHAFIHISAAQMKYLLCSVSWSLHTVFYLKITFCLFAYLGVFVKHSVCLWSYDSLLIL